MAQSALLLLILLLPLLLLQKQEQVESLPLSTRGRWIVDATTGSRVKLRCVNWAAHMPVVLAEGLDRRPLPEIAVLIADLGFNCVRLTWATHMFTVPHYVNLTVAGSLRGQNLSEALEGVERNNPSMMEMTVAEAYEEVVNQLGISGLMVVLDNHVSKPKWCCGREDGNGFFGDTFFDPEEWLQGLDSVARRFCTFPQVVAMSMRNELRGPKQTHASWYNHVTLGVRTINTVNPNVLIIVSGLNFDTDLSFLLSRPLPIHSLKLVYEAHWYAFSEGKQEEWESPTHSPSHICSAVAERFHHRAGFMAPLFVSEFGMDQRGLNRADNHFMTCFLGFAAERDIDWAMWALQGSYYRRDGVDGFEESYGVLRSDWSGPKHQDFSTRFRLIQSTLRDPTSKHENYKIIYHPLTGKCIQVIENTILLMDCQGRTRWSHIGNAAGPIRLAETNLCIGFQGHGRPVSLTTDCNNSWKAISGREFQIGFHDENLGKKTCLDGNSSLDTSQIFAKKCMCLGGSVCSQNPQSQWFRLITSNVY
ncbi:hypothetical protein ZOSMA_5G00600 [Zostera marina]|uniref:Glycoside hydrolase family 5 domain-containing protein n=1 Tax=Zostera marina TaxID=29655 RepID=A0A0K9NVY2_ZOSMR|nr:hypothetical protein ZOSMA_5G00600 [Zostera marina]